MKNIAAILILISGVAFCPVAFAQDADESTTSEKEVIFPIDSSSGRVAYSRIIVVEGVSAAELLRRAERFAKEDRSKFYVTSGNRNVMAGNSLRGDEATMTNAKASTGYASTDAETSTVICGIVWQFQGSTMRCVYDMSLTGELIIKTKDGRAKVSITNITYANYGRGNRDLVKLNGMRDSGPCSSHGNLEQTVDCRVCRKPLRKMNDWMQTTADVLLDKAVSSLSSNVKDEKW